MELKKFRYYLITSGATVEVPHAPIGYDEAIAAYKRDMNYWGVIRSFTFPLSFVLSGGEYLKSIFMNKGIDEIVTLRVDKLDNSTLSYFTLYSGELDFSQAKVTNTAIEVPVMDGDLQSKVKAYEKTIFEYSLADTATEVNLFGTDFSDLVTMGAAGSAAGIQQKILETNIINANIETGVFEAQPQFLEDVVGSGGQPLVNFTTSENWFLKSNAGTTVNITGTINCNFKNFGNNIRQFYRVGVACSDSSSGNPYIMMLSTQNYTDSNQHNNVVFNINIQLNLRPGVRFFLTLYPALYSNVDSNFSINECILSISRVGTTENRKIKAIKPIDLFDRLVNSMRPFTNIQSNLLRDCKVLITCGDAIRGFENPVLKTSFSDFNKSMDAVFCTGFSTHNNVAILENRNYFFRNTYQIDELSDVKNLTIQPFNEFVVSNISVGYPSETYDSERGREEFNQPQNWKTPTYRSQRTLDIMSVYRADQFGVEELLKKNFTETPNETSTDSKSDNDIFMLWVKDDTVLGIYQLKTALDFDYVTGVSDRRYTYNIDLSPKHNLMRHMEFIRSTFHGVNENGYIVLSSAEKNDMLQVTSGGRTLIEKEPLFVKDFTERVFYPYMVKFTTDYSRNIKQMIDQSPDGFIKFSHNGYWFSGYIYEIKIDISKDSEQEFTLILSKDNIINNLIK